ncbi:MAG: hypothetical protein L6300_05680 [Syntrophaceae bacterium]|nr:hypothetical protein [bacterium]MCG2739711.1 hypothetical protein [Syntrophaceae bacterium]
MDFNFENELGLTSIWIDIYYDPGLQMITGKPKDRIIVSKGCPFLMMLHSVFVEYPEIYDRYPPGTLGLTLNGVSPDDFATLEEDDKVCFTVLKNAYSMFQ